MDIPVYGLYGVDGLAKKLGQRIKQKKAASSGQAVSIVKKASGNGKAGSIIKKLSTTGGGKSFAKFVSKIADAKRRKAITDKHNSTLRGIEGIFNTAAQKISTGNGTTKDAADMKKARVLISLADTDYDAFRLASIYMPYVADIDEEDGGYYFDNEEVANVAAAGEDEFIAYASSPQATELGKLKIFKKIGKAVKKAAKTVAKATKTVAKAVAKTTTAAVKATANAVKTATKATVNAVKATGNLVKAGAQAATGHGSAAKSTLKKAVQQAKAATVTAAKDTIKKSVVAPTKTVVQQTKAVVKDAIIEPTKTFVLDPLKQTIKIAGKVFKVLFLKINPITVLIRSSLRGLMSLNFLGMATRLGVGLLTEKEADLMGYSKEKWEKAKKALERVKKLFKKMGGDPSKLEKSIRNGAKKKLFKPLNNKQKIELDKSDNGEATLAEPATIAAMIAACVGILTSIWSWIKSIVADRKANKEAAEQKKKEEETRAYNAEHYEVDANGNPIVDEYGRPIPKGKIDADKAAAAAMAAQMATVAPTDEKKKTNWAIYAILGGVLIGGALLMSKGKGKKRR